MMGHPGAEKRIVFLNFSTCHDFLFKTVFCRSEGLNARFEKQSSIYAKPLHKLDQFKVRLEEEHESWLRPG
jgi:hypothetical protein